MILNEIDPNQGVGAKKACLLHTEQIRDTPMVYPMRDERGTTISGTPLRQPGTVWHQHAKMLHLRNNHDPIILLLYTKYGIIVHGCGIDTN